MTVERVSAERSECLQRIDQRALQERLEAEKRQVTHTTCTEAELIVPSGLKYLA